MWRGQSYIQGFSVGWTLPEHIMCSGERFFVCMCMLAFDWKVYVNRELVSSIVNFFVGCTVHGILSV